MNNLKVFISVDMEGITGVTKWTETNVGQHDYEYYRTLMTQEANAAIEGAIAAGATEIVVRDAHDSGCNLIPDKLHRYAKLIRSWSDGPLSMMEGIDRGFDAALLIGYHAKANTPNAVLKHTMSLCISDLRVNGVSLSEGAWNALIAGYYGVPIAFVSGDEAVCDYSRELLGDIETVAVKEGLGVATLNLHPSVAQEQIRQGVTKALSQVDKYKPFTFAPEYFLEITFTQEDRAARGQWYPGAERVDANTVGFRSSDFFECMRFFHLVG
ncbi:MAG: aminopeptidase [Bacillota bacterium]|nr:MAG: aminopeptidase [Bacillota bacterium]MBS3949304.1 M55 family metallopeptidase [Peptococcaceae bacterium]